MVKSKLALVIASLVILMSACVNDSSKPSTPTEVPTAAPVENVNSQSQNTNPTDDHSGHNHDGHNHDGHDHDGHDHSSHAQTNQTQSQNQSHTVIPKAKPTDPGNVIREKVDNTANINQQLEDLENSKGSISAEKYEQKKAAINAIPKTSVQERPAKSYQNLPNACTLISEKALGDIIGVDHMAISLKDGSGPPSSRSRACFFRWDHKGIPNSGVMIQVQDNPLPDEFPDWAAYFIQAKLQDGDKGTDASMSFKYKPLDDLGVKGAYNYELHRYNWRTEQGQVFMVAFNLPSSEDQEVDWVKKIGKEVMKNLY